MFLLGRIDVRHGGSSFFYYSKPIHYHKTYSLLHFKIRLLASSSIYVISI
jgi:hypothetical protein